MHMRRCKTTWGIIIREGPSKGNLNKKYIKVNRSVTVKSVNMFLQGIIQIKITPITGKRQELILVLCGKFTYSPQGSKQAAQ